MTTVVLQAWCPACLQMAMPAQDGACVWCGTPTRDAPPARLGKPVGKWGYLTEPQVRACHALYMLDLPRRERIAATVMARRTHGLCPRGGPRIGYGAYRRNVLEGRPDRPQCQGVRQNAPRKGARCRLRAVEGSAYCVCHDPDRAEFWRAHLAALRARRAEA